MNNLGNTSDVKTAKEIGEAVQNASAYYGEVINALSSLGEKLTEQIAEDVNGPYPFSKSETDSPVKIYLERGSQGFFYATIQYSFGLEAQNQLMSAVFGRLSRPGDLCSCLRYNFCGGKPSLSAESLAQGLHKTTEDMRNIYDKNKTFLLRLIDSKRTSAIDSLMYKTADEMLARYQKPAKP